MTPHDMSKYREAFNAAAASFGWTMRVVRESHERDYNCHWDENVWLSSDGSRLFEESDIEEGMVKEIIRLASPVGVRE